MKKDIVFNELIIDDAYSVSSVAVLLEKLRCRVVYLVTDQKLVGSVSDGDIRRYVANNGEINDNVCKIVNYSPRFCTEQTIHVAKNVFENSEIYSLPIVNLNNEIVGILFRDGKILRNNKSLHIPVVMMAGGKGTRLYPYTKILPKALVPIGETPISEMIFDRFSLLGCNEFFMILNHKSEMIKSYYSSLDSGYNIGFETETTPMGTGGGLALLKGKLKEDFILTNCDVLIDADYVNIIDKHKKEKNHITLILAEFSMSIPYGVVSVDSDGNYECFEEKPVAHKLINTGVYVVSEKVLDELKPGTKINFPEIINVCKQNGYKIGSYIVDEDAYMDMGQLEEMDKMKKKLMIN